MANLPQTEEEVRGLLTTMTQNGASDADKKIVIDGFVRRAKEQRLATEKAQGDKRLQGANKAANIFGTVSTAVNPLSLFAGGKKGRQKLEEFNTGVGRAGLGVGRFLGSAAERLTRVPSVLATPNKGVKFKDPTLAEKFIPQEALVGQTPTEKFGKTVADVGIGLATGLAGGALTAPLAETALAAKGAQLASKVPLIGNITQKGASIAPRLAGESLGATEAFFASSEGRGATGKELALGALSDAALVGLLAPAFKVAKKEVSKFVSKTAKRESAVNRNIRSLQTLEDSNTSLRKKTNKFKNDVKSIVAETDLLKGSVTPEGRIRTTLEGGAIDRLQGEIIKPQEDIIARILAVEKKTVPLEVLRKDAIELIEGQRAKGAGRKSVIKMLDDELNAFAEFADDPVKGPDLSDIHDRKREIYQTLNYANPSISKDQKLVAKALKEAVENNTTSADVRALNDELKKHFEVLNYLEALDNKTVKKGRLGKYFAQGFGVLIGSNFGPLGSVAGLKLGDALVKQSFRSTFSEGLGRGIQRSDIVEDALQELPARASNAQSINTTPTNNVTADSISGVNVRQSLPQNNIKVNSADVLSGIEVPARLNRLMDILSKFETADDLNIFLNESRALIESGAQLSDDLSYIKSVMNDPFLSQKSEIGLGRLKDSFNSPVEGLLQLAKVKSL